MSNSLRTAARRVAAVALASGLGVAAAQAQEFTMGYSVGFLTDPFQAIQVDLTMAEAEKAGLQTLPVANANGDAGKQITDFHNLIAQGAQARGSEAIRGARRASAPGSSPSYSARSPDSVVPAQSRSPCHSSASPSGASAAARERRRRHT